MKVVKGLTRAFSIALFCTSSLNAHENTNNKKFIVRLKEPNDSPSQSITPKERFGRRHDKLNRFRKDRLSHKKTQLLNNTGFLITEELSEEELNKLRNDPDVAYIEQDIKWVPQNYAGVPDELPSSFEQSPWLRDVLGFSDTNPDPYIAPDFNKNRVVVAVIDTGTRINHPFLSSALEPNFREINGRSGVDDDQNGFIDDTYGANAITKNGNANEIFTSHGTHVTGIVKAVRDQAISQFSEAQQISILPIRFIGDDGAGSTSAAITALEYAVARGAKVINASWGAKGQAAFSQALYETFVSLYVNNDVFFSVAAGNADSMGVNDNDQIPHFPANFNIPSLMSVASLTPVYQASGNRYFLQQLRLSEFSNFGSTSVHIAAPGGLSMGGQGILSAYSDFGTWGNLYIRKQGTSMAAPVVAGIAAVMRAVNPNLSSYEIKQLIFQSSEKHSALANIRDSAFLKGKNAIVLAQQTSARGVRPPVPSNTVTRSRAHRTEFENTSGCTSGSIAPHLQDQGPFGGNSLGLISLLYMISFILRKSLRPHK